MLTIISKNDLFTVPEGEVVRVDIEQTTPSSLLFKINSPCGLSISTRFSSRKGMPLHLATTKSKVASILSDPNGILDIEEVVTLDNGEVCKRIAGALDAAVTALHFADNSDYLAALHQVVAELKGVDISTLNSTTIEELFNDLNSSK